MKIYSWKILLSDFFGALVIEILSYFFTHRISFTLKATQRVWVIWSRYTDLESEAFWGKCLAGATCLLGASCGTTNPVSRSMPGPAAPTPPRVLRQVLPTPWASVSSSVEHTELDELKGIFWLWPFRTFSFELLKKIGNKKGFLYRYKDKLILKILFNSFSEETIVVLQPVQKRVQRRGAFRNQTYWNEFANGDRTRWFFFFFFPLQGRDGCFPTGKNSFACLQARIIWHCYQLSTVYKSINNSQSQIR